MKSKNESTTSECEIIRSINFQVNREDTILKDAFIHTTKVLFLTYLNRICSQKNKLSSIATALNTPDPRK